MVKCLNADGTNACFWADYDPAAGVHRVVEKPDYLMQTDPRKAPPMYREQQGCGLGRNDWRLSGPMGHNCPKYVDFAVQKEAIEAEKEALRETFECRTQRKKIADGASMFDYLPVMMEASKVAYDWLMDIYMAYGDMDPSGVLDFFAKLNDMNIRGEQIDVLLAQYFPGYPRYPRGGKFIDQAEEFFRVLRERPKDIVRTVNDNYEHADTEEAVLSGASTLAHL